MTADRNAPDMNAPEINAPEINAPELKREPEAVERSYAEAIRDAMDIALASDERVILLGEDIGVYGGAFQVTGDLVHKYGEDRVMDTPISELGGAGVAVGAALTGLRPILSSSSQILRRSRWSRSSIRRPKRYMLGGGASVPLVMRFPAGSEPSRRPADPTWRPGWRCAGLKVIQPATPHDAKGMLLAALEDPDPVMMFEHKLLYKQKGLVPQGHYTVPIGKAALRRQGSDVTIVATSLMVQRSLAAAEALEEDGISAEVIDLRTIRPIDRATVLASVEKTSRLVCVYEGVKTLGIGAEISAMVAESPAFDFLDAPILRLGGSDNPIPYNPELEKASVPQVEDILAGVTDLVRRRR